MQEQTVKAALQSLPRHQRSEISHLLSRLNAGLQSILADQLLGIYLYGSLITGDFDFTVSDIDLVVVLKNALDGHQFTALQNLHANTLRAFPAWDNRLELAYISGPALRAFQSMPSTIGIISPGEPFHLIQAGSDWLISWYALRRDGVALLGPPIDRFIDPIPLADWLRAVKEHIHHYHESVKKPHDKPGLSYIVLTVARGLYTLEHESDVSKIKAAQWATAAYPRWADLIQRAQLYRHNANADQLPSDQLQPQVAAFLTDVLEKE